MRSRNIDSIHIEFTTYSANYVEFNALQKARNLMGRKLVRSIYERSKISISRHWREKLWMGNRFNIYHFFMSSSASSYFHRFLIVNTVIATLVWWWFLLPDYFPLIRFLWLEYILLGISWAISFSITALFGIFSFTLFSWKSWRYSIIDPSFSALKTGLRISLSWMAVWDMLLLWTILIDYFQNPGSFYGLFIDNLYSFWERSPEEFGPFIALWVMIFLLLLPIIFSITGFYLDRRKNKALFPWSGTILLFGIIILLIWMNIRL